MVLRTNHSNVTEVASVRTNLEKYQENWEHIFGKKKEESKEEKDESVHDELPNEAKEV
jgi:hypothetical protein